MEELSPASGDSPPLSPLPEGLDDPDDTNAPLYQDEDPPAAPVADPTADMDDLSDNDSVLSEVDEAQFEDFDPTNIAIEDRPAIAVDEDTVKALGRYKRKRDGEDGEGVKKKRKEGKREKPKKLRKKKDSDEDDFSGGQEIEGKRRRKTKHVDEGGVSRKERVRPRKATPENEEALDPEERRRRALDRAMDAALKNPSRRRRRADGIDINTLADEEIASLRIRMAEAAEMDVHARSQNPPKPAMHKLRLLPEVTALLNRNNREIESAIVDPENNLLESVRFFLEPLSDGSLPGYNIQRELFASLAKLPIDKEALISSGIGKVVLFYTKSKKPEPTIKRQAERLLGEWTRPILKRSDDFRKRHLQTADYDPSRLPLRPNAASGGAMPFSATQTAQEAREKMLAPPNRGNRARVEAKEKTYTIAPRSGAVAGGVFARPLGASGEDAFRKMKARQAAAQGKGRR
ncbi:MAG: hypothetical protein LQ348_002328 [Seirophora lacunosa]|nr:MAG: hypothetical protein LQ344_001205 [Seirophora lacunosa]KAI4196387.1 MAG: hypothetical protein LQ348_002328 [Seirophora lacunosa]